MKFFLYQNAYWEDPSDKQIPHGAIEVPKRPDNKCVWNGNAWISDENQVKSERKQQVNDELSRLTKFLLLQKDEKRDQDLAKYVQDLQDYVSMDLQSVKKDFVVCPASLRDEAFFDGQVRA